MTDPPVIMVLVVIVGSIVGIAIARRIRRRVNAARIAEGESWRELTVQERIAFARLFSRERGRWFRLLLCLGAVLILSCAMILWYLGFIFN